MFDFDKMFRQYAIDPPKAIPKMVDTVAAVEVGSDEAPVDIALGGKLRIGGKGADGGNLADEHPGTISRVRTLNANVVSTGLTYTFAAFDPPTLTKFWEVMRLAVDGSDPFTSLAGVSVVAFIVEQVPQASNTEPVAFPDILGPPGSVPNVMNPSRRELIIRFPQLIVLAFKGLANAQQVSAWLTVIEHDSRLFSSALGS